MTLAKAAVLESIIGPRIVSFRIAALSADVGTVPPLQLAAFLQSRSPVEFVQSLSTANALVAIKIAKKPEINDLAIFLLASVYHIKI